MKVFIFIFITLCLISGQVLCVKVFGCTGGSLMFKCMYKTESKTDDQHKLKSFCRDKSCKMGISSDDQHKVKSFCRDMSCKMGISSDVQSQWVYSGRFALYDDENSRFFTVFIRNLSREDKGKYTCGNNQTWSHDVTIVVNNISESSCGKSVIQDGYLGQKTITFRCEYDEKFKTYTKVFYRLKDDPVHVLNSSRLSQSSEEKFILSDNHKDHFNVTIRDISAAGGGVYLCGVERNRSDHRPSETSVTHITFSTEIQLNLYDTDTERKASQDKGKSDSFVIVAVSVGLILLAVCLVLMLLKIKYSCKHGIVSSSDRRQTGDHEMVQDSDPTSTHLYSTVQLSTIPSDLQNPLYSTAQLPTIPSDLQNPLYSTAQLPKIPSEGLLYASVSFQNEESLSDAKVAFRKNEIQCDYASVKHNNTPNYDYH